MDAHPESTCWTAIRAAAAGDRGQREEFVRRYAPAVRAYLGARWRTSPLAREIEDVAQDVFLDCFRAGGALERVREDRGEGFRAYLFGVVRNVALRAERARARDRLRPVEGPLGPEGIPHDDAGPATAFDQAWTTTLLREAARTMERRAERGDEAARRRVALLHHRFRDGLPIRDIARRWEVDAALLHREYARAREEFHEALLETLAFHHPGTRAELEREAARLLEAYP